MTCWFEPLILRLGPRSSRYDVICRGYTYGEGHDNWCLIQGERVSTPRVCRRSPSTDALARNAIEGPARVSAVTRAVAVFVNMINLIVLQ